MKTSAFGWAKRHGQLLMKVMPAATLAHAAAERFDVTTHKPLSQGTLSKAAVASRSLHSANLNETPIQSLLELSQQLFREIHLEVSRPAFTHAMRCVPQACRRGSGLKVSLRRSFVRWPGPADRSEHRMVLLLSTLWHTTSLMSETCARRPADLQRSANQSAAAAQAEVGIIWTCLSGTSNSGLKLFQASQNPSSSHNFFQVARC